MTLAQPLWAPIPSRRGTSVLEPAAYPDSEVLVLYEDGRTEVVVYEDAASLEEGLPQLARQEGVALVQPN